MKANNNNRDIVSNMGNEGKTIIYSIKFISFIGGRSLLH